MLIRSPRDFPSHVLGVGGKSDRRRGTRARSETAHDGYDDYEGDDHDSDDGGVTIRWILNKAIKLVAAHQRLFETKTKKNAETQHRKHIGGQGDDLRHDTLPTLLAANATATINVLAKPQ